eukprot:TRINITY_DN47624_c0_g1_i1.p2 TRINITY_DN47624_c0_g1~~TRINITY_DN47624_c0_g1_i1.p2  ORF type:complete len:430 (+),score=89.28 TRINITY_DN47624_c0_g1_i1:60-1349(+)
MYHCTRPFPGCVGTMWGSKRAGSPYRSQEEGLALCDMPRAQGAPTLWRMAPLRRRRRKVYRRRSRSPQGAPAGQPQSAPTGQQDEGGYRFPSDVIALALSFLSKTELRRCVDVCTQWRLAIEEDAGLDIELKLHTIRDQTFDAVYDPDNLDVDPWDLNFCFADPPPEVALREDGWVELHDGHPSRADSQCGPGCRLSSRWGHRMCNKPVLQVAASQRLRYQLWPVEGGGSPRSTPSSPRLVLAPSVGSRITLQEGFADAQSGDDGSPRQAAAPRFHLQRASCGAIIRRPPGAPHWGAGRASELAPLLGVVGAGCAHPRDCPPRCPAARVTRLPAVGAGGRLPALSAPPSAGPQQARALGAAADPQPRPRRPSAGHAAAAAPGPQFIANGEAPWGPRPAAWPNGVARLPPPQGGGAGSQPQHHSRRSRDG